MLIKFTFCTIAISYLTNIVELIDHVNYCVASFVLAILIEIIIIPHVLLVSKKKRLYDVPNQRKSHCNPISRLGGTTFLSAIMLSFFPILAIQIIFCKSMVTFSLLELIICIAFVISGAIPLVLLGIKDDLVGVRYLDKFIIQIISALFLIASGTWVNNLYGLLGIYELSPYIGIPFTILLIVYIINSINLIDGVDGLAGTIACISAFTLGSSSLLFSQLPFSYALLAFSTLGVLFPFLYYNMFSKRKIFMGDTGSLTLGYILAFLSIRYAMYTPSKPTLLSQPIIIVWSILFIPLFDTARVICIRASHKRPIFSPDRNHIHHKLLDIGYTHKQTTLTLALYTLFIIASNMILKNSLNINIILLLNLITGVFFNTFLNKYRKKIELLNKKALNTKIALGDYFITSKFTFNRIPDQQIVVNTINPHSWITAKKDAEFKHALQNSNKLIPDGIGIALAIKWITGLHIHKTAGADLHRIILKELNEISGTLFYLGASENVLSKIVKRIHIEYPNIEVNTYCPPYRAHFSEEETNQMINAVNTFSPNVLFVGMTAPKQEKWIEANKHRLQTQFISGIGAVFGFYAGTTPRAPRWMVACGLEWLGRLLREPRHTWKRNFISTPLFLFDITLLKFNKETIKENAII